MTSNVPIHIPQTTPYQLMYSPAISHTALPHSRAERNKAGVSRAMVLHHPFISFHLWRGATVDIGSIVIEQVHCLVASVRSTAFHHVSQSDMLRLFAFIILLNSPDNNRSLEQIPRRGVAIQRIRESMLTFLGSNIPGASRRSVNLRSQSATACRRPLLQVQGVRMQPALHLHYTNWSSRHQTTRAALIMIQTDRRLLL